MIATIKRKKPISQLTDITLDTVKVAVSITGIIVNTSIELVRAAFYLIFFD